MQEQRATTTWLLLGAAIGSEVIGSLSLRAALEQGWWYAVVVMAYLVAFTLLRETMRRGMALGVAYGIWGALGVALTAVASAAIFGEALNATMVLGMALVIAGVLCVELGSQSAASRSAAGARTPEVVR